MYIKRIIEDKINEISKEFPVLILTGSRQVGKSTVLRMIKPKAMNYVTLDDLDARSLAIKDPKYFLEFYKYPLIIDEIQYAPKLLSYIKIVVDEESFNNLKNGRKNKCLFWLTGSQQFSLMKNVSESLAGRIAVLNLYSLSNEEKNGLQSILFNPSIDELTIRAEKRNVNSNKNIFEKIFEGGMPKLISSNTKREDYFSSYLNTYIERDIKELSNIGKTIEFYNFMQFLAVRTATELNYETISKEIGVDGKTIKKWISVLEASGIIYLLKPFFKNVSSRIIKSPKIYFMDTGLCSYLAKWPNYETLEVGAMSGSIFETYVVSEIIKNLSNHGVDPKNYLFYYRDKNQKEIDLLYFSGNDIVPIGIKKGVSPNNPDKNFHVLEKYDLNIKPGIVICMTNRIVPIKKDVWLYPIDFI